MVLLRGQGDDEGFGMIDACLLDGMHARVRSSRVNQQLYFSHAVLKLPFSDKRECRYNYSVFLTQGTFTIGVQALVESLRSTDPTHTKGTRLLQGQAVWDTKTHLCVGNKVLGKCARVRLDPLMRTWTNLRCCRERSPFRKNRIRGLCLGAEPWRHICLPV